MRCWHYASTSRGAVNYYKLTPDGYRLLNGPKSELPSKRFFQPVSLALQQHTRSLADFIVHTAVSARMAGVAFTDFYRENDLHCATDCPASFLQEHPISYVDSYEEEGERDDEGPIPSPLDDEIRERLRALSTWIRSDCLRASERMTSNCLLP